MTMFAKITLVLFAMVLLVKAGPLPEPQFGFGWPFPSTGFGFGDIMGQHARAHSVATAGFGDFGGIMGQSSGLLNFGNVASIAGANGDGMKGIACTSHTSPDGKTTTCMYTTEDGKVVKKIIEE